MEEKRERVIKDYYPKGYVAKVVQAVVATLIRVAAYCRVSTNSEEQLNSFKNQVAHYTPFIKNNPEWEFVGIYADEGLSGLKAKKRDEFMRLIRDALSGKIDLILVKSVSRFARNTLDFMQTIRDLRAAKVGVFFEEHNLNSIDPNNDFMLNFIAGMAEQESRNISNNVKWGKKRKRDAGIVMFNFNCVYGYRQDEFKNVTIVEEEAEVIRDMYFKYLLGYSYKTIADDLMARGIKSPLGSDVWNQSTVKNILENEKYDGNVILQKYKKDDMHAAYAKKCIDKNKIALNNHVPIVSRETWLAVQAEIDRRKNLRSKTTKTGKGRYDARYAFSGLLLCGCGGSYRRHIQYVNGKVVPAWVCKKHNTERNACKSSYIKEAYIEEMFVRTLNGLIKSREKIVSVVESAVGESLVEVSELEFDDTGLNEIEAEVASLQKQIEGLHIRRAKREIDAIQYNDESCGFLNRMDELFSERDNILEQRGKALLDNAMKEMFTEFFKAAQVQAAFDKEVFTRLVENIKVIDKDNIVFVFRDGTEIKGNTGADIAGQ